jgi:dihydropteroate synthase
MHQALTVLEADTPQALAAAMRGMGVDPYGIRLMVPKAQSRLILLRKLKPICANIIKQEMLSFGGDAAVARGALTGSVAHTDCLIMGTAEQYRRLAAKLTRQPFGLSGISSDLRDFLAGLERRTFTVSACARTLRLGPGTGIMGIVNVTPDSFSGDGLCASSCRGAGVVEAAVEKAREMVRLGARIIDVGGESTRPGAPSVSLKEELSRTVPVVRALAKTLKVPISIDTSKPRVAEAALDQGACIVNDITGLRNPEMIKVASRAKAGVIIMHMRGTVRTMQKDPHYGSVVDEVLLFLSRRMEQARDAGISGASIMIDPGIGIAFGKTAAHNFSLLKHLRTFTGMGVPVVVGPSRKSFIGTTLNLGPEQRVYGTVAASLEAARRGAALVRVHDVAAVSQALRIATEVEQAL